MLHVKIFFVISSITPCEPLLELILMVSGNAVRNKLQIIRHSLNEVLVWYSILFCTKISQTYCKVQVWGPCGTVYMNYLVMGWGSIRETFPSPLDCSQSRSQGLPALQLCLLVSPPSPFPWTGSPMCCIWLRLSLHTSPQHLGGSPLWDRRHSHLQHGSAVRFICTVIIFTATSHLSLERMLYVRDSESHGYITKRLRNSDSVIILFYI